MKYLGIIVIVLFCSCSSTIYIVRHAEKAATAPGGSSDVPLTTAGEERAIVLKNELAGKHITEVFSTNYNRTRSTAKPTADQFGLTVTIYAPPQPDDAFINLLRSKRKNILVVGHSNTIDDIANKLAGSTVVPGDLPETEFDNLFILKKKKNKYVFSKKKYGAASH